ncbi:MAG TPA: divalent-cation tolerance protein CutA [Opitutus sp.]|nr:divalent-cation tolerance protein CutA [Opitutus sp.]
MSNASSGNAAAPSLLVGWTTFSRRAEAEAFAEDVVTRGWVICAQIEASIVSIYRWQGKLERGEEVRLTLKFLPQHAGALDRHLRDHHPYETPEWIVVAASHVAEKYLSWAKANPSTPPL